MPASKSMRVPTTSKVSTLRSVNGIGIFPSNDLRRDFHILPDCIGIGAGDMGLLDEFFGYRLGHAGKADVQCYCDAETLLVGAGTEAYVCGDGRVRGNRDGFLFLGTDIFDRAQEAGG